MKYLQIIVTNFVLLFILTSSVFAQQITSGQQVTTTQNAQSTQWVVSSSGGSIPVPDVNLPGGTVVQVLDRIFNWLLMIFVILAVASFVITGLQFIFSFGGTTGLESKAKTNFTYTIIAIFVAGGALIILKAVLYFLGNEEMSTGTTQSAVQSVGGAYQSPTSQGQQAAPSSPGSY